MTKTDAELAGVLKCSIDSVINVRHEHKLYKDWTEVSGPTSIELFVKNVLDQNQIQYIFNQPLESVKPDFQIVGTNILIEVQGNYWHCNPKLYENGPKDLIQMQHVLRDYTKKCFYTSKSYIVLYIWEYDIKNHPEQVKSEILNLILPSPRVI